MTNLQQIQNDLDIICPGWKLFKHQVLEIQYKDFNEKNVMLLANKLNFPQCMTIKVDIQTNRISEIYPTAMDKFDDTLFSVPYYSISVHYENDVPILDKEPTDYYFINKTTEFDDIFKKAGISEFYIIQRLDVNSNKRNKWYVNLKLPDIQKVCNQKTTDFILSKSPDNIFIYSNNVFDDCSTLLLSYLPIHHLFR
jgi:hypothetical protein